MDPNGTLSIGELAERAGVTVKTVRFYSDYGLLPEAVRSSGGHRRYHADALDRLRLIRSLRALDLPVPEVGHVLDQEDALPDVIARQLGTLGAQLTALRWREAALHLLHDCPAAERATNLRLIGAMSTPPSTDSVVRFWRYRLPAKLPPRLISSILDAAIPQPPTDPTPEQVLTFAKLHALTLEHLDHRRPDRLHPDARPPDIGDPALLYFGLSEAYPLATPALLAQQPAHQGEALDCFVAAYTHSFGVDDTPAFRRKLSGALAKAAAADPRLDRYWQIAAELSPEPTLGAAHDWLRTALHDAGRATSS